MIIRRPKEEEFSQWLDMRIDLWPHCPKDEHLVEISQYYEGKPMDCGIETQILVCVSDTGELAGFIELSLRSQLEGFDTAPIGYIEGWYIKSFFRRKGLGGMLVTEGEKWAIEKGCSEMASDAEKDNIVSIEAHKRLGYIIFGTSEEEVLFRKRLK